MSRRWTIALTFVIGIAAGWLLHGPNRTAMPHPQQLSVNIPHPDIHHRRINHELKVHRITNPDGSNIDLGESPDQPEWQIKINGTTYRASVAE